MDRPSPAPGAIPPRSDESWETREDERTRVNDERARLNDERAKLADERARDLRKQGDEKPDAKKDEQEQKDRDGQDDDKDKPGLLTRALGWVRTHLLITLVVLVLLVAAIVAAVLWWLNARHFESTDDAFIDARSFSLAARVSGYVVDVPVTDNQHVEAGAVVAKIDERDYRANEAQADAQVKSASANIDNVNAQILAQNANIQHSQTQVVQAQAALQFAQQEAARSTQLAQTGNGTVQQAQQTQSNLAQGQANLAGAQQSVDQAKSQVAVLVAQRASAVANLAQMQAQLETARLNLSYTTVTAAQGGRVVRLTAAKGQYAEPGLALAMFVPDQIWVTANFKETQITDMRPGQPVELHLDAYPGRALQGRVDSVQAGSGTAFSLLPAQNATGNYVKVVQRVPVKLTIDHPPPDMVLGPGLSVVPRVRVR